MNEEQEKPVLGDLKRELEEDPAWDAKQARRLVWRTRLKLFFSVVRVVAGLLLAYALYVAGVQIWYSQSGSAWELERQVTTLIETHQSGLRVEKGGFARREISPFLTRTLTRPLYQEVGHWAVIVGEVRATKPLFGELRVETDLNERYLHQNKEYPFALPPSLFGTYTPMRNKGADEQVWKQLSHVEDGFVAQMAFSTWVPMQPEQLVKVLSRYDLRVLDMPVFAGELKAFTPMHYSGGDFKHVPHLSLRPSVEYGADPGSLQWQGDFQEGVGTEGLREALIRDVEWLIEQGEYPERANDQLRLDYLKRHGVEVYGAVVTGPVRELEKLRREADFHHFQLGRIEVWNWR